jgi:hypothetical protein
LDILVTAIKVIVKAIKPYSSPSYGSPNVFSIIKTSPLTTDDDVYALNNYDTLTLESGSSDHLTITGDKANKKVTLALKQVVTTVAGDSGATTGLVLAPTAKRTSGQILLTGTTLITTMGDNRLADAATGALATRIMITDANNVASPGTAGQLTVTQASAGSWTIVSSQASDVRNINYLLVN